MSLGADAMNRRVLPLVAGVLFGAGACISGMVRPSKVLAFLDLRGAWDASLLVVMGAALALTALAWRDVRRLRRPRFGAAFPGPPPAPIDAKLVGGSALFGLGWGLGGYCPGPAIVGLASRVPAALVFGLAMAIGMLVGDRARGAGADG